MYKKYFTLSYDDGVEQDKKLIDLLNKYGLKATFNINSGMFGRKHSFQNYGRTINPNRVEKTDVPSLYFGHEVATHSVNHPSIALLSRDEIIQEISEDKKALSDMVGYEVRGHAYPNGSFSDTVVKCLSECGIDYARTTVSTHTFSLPEFPLLWHATCKHDDPEVFSLLERFIEAKPLDGDILFYLWGHAYEFDYEIPHSSWEHIESICRMISGKKDIIYCTNKQVLETTNENETSTR